MFERLTSIIPNRRPAVAQDPCDAQLPHDCRSAYEARACFIDLAEKMARRERIPLHLAMARLKVERPAEYRAAFPARRSGRTVAIAPQLVAGRLLLERAV